MSKCFIGGHSVCLKNLSLRGRRPNKDREAKLEPGDITRKQPPERSDLGLFPKLRDPLTMRSNDEVIGINGNIL